MRFLNLWMEDKPFTLDTLNDLPRYVAKDSYQTVLDDTSGYDHILLLEDSRTGVPCLLYIDDRHNRQLHLPLAVSRILG